MKLLFVHDGTLKYDKISIKYYHIGRIFERNDLFWDRKRIENQKKRGRCYKIL